MDQTPSKSTDQQRRQIDQNNNSENSKSSSYNSYKENTENQQKLNACNCTNISIMQLFHEMKQEFPKVPDHIVQQLVTENCHNRRACLEQLQKVVASSMTTPTMYPSKSIHNSNANNNNNTNKQQQSETERSPLNGTKWRGMFGGKSDSNQKMKEISERFENVSISSSSEASTSSDIKVMKRPTTLPLRRAPDPPTHSSSSVRSSPPSAISTPSSTTSVSSFSTATASSQMHHNVILDSTASKINDSLNVQLNVKVSPILSTKRPAPPPPPAKPNSNNQRYTSHLSVKPEPPYTSMLDPKNNLIPLGCVGGATACTGTSGQRSYTNVKLTLRQPSSTSSLTPIDIQAGPQTLSYSSSSFNAQQGCESHLKITVAGNGESCIQAVRTAKNVPEINQIDTTINIEGNYVMNDDGPQYRIISNPFIPQQLALPPLQSCERRLTEDELRQLIKRQRKQKESLECELEKEREKLQMIRLDIITLTSPVMTHLELKELCDDITRLRTVCGRLSDEIDVATSPPRTAILSASSPNAPPPIPKGLVSRKGHSPSNSLLPHIDTCGLRYPTHEPPSYNDVMRETERIRSPIESNLINDDNKWTCTLCTFHNHCALNICEACEMPRVQGITITSSSFRPLHSFNQLQGSSVPSTNDNKSSNSNNNSSVVHATAL